MNHQDALKQGRNKTDCTGQLDKGTSFFSQDFTWVEATCRACGEKIALLGGLAHRFNYVIQVDLPDDDWRIIEAKGKQDLEAIQSDADAIRFIQTYLSEELRPNYLEIYRSDRHEMGRTPRQAIDNLLSVLPL